MKESHFNKHKDNFIPRILSQDFRLFGKMAFLSLSEAVKPGSREVQLLEACIQNNTPLQVPFSQMCHSLLHTFNVDQLNNNS